MGKAAKPPQTGFCKSMAWLHTWCGLWFSWLLYAVFLTGTLAVFDEPITHWMAPEHALAEAQAPESTAPVVNLSQRLAWGVDYMAKTHPQADMWELWPVNRNHNNGLVAYWFDKNGGYDSKELSTETGQPVPPNRGQPLRATMGATTLWTSITSYTRAKLACGSSVSPPWPCWSRWCRASSCTNASSRTSLFTFRPKKGQRSWLDAHNALAVLTLPFLFMIAYTGIAISGLTFMPAAAVAEFGEGGLARAQKAINDPGNPVRTGQPLAVPDLEPLVMHAQQLIGQQVRAVVIDNPGDSSMRIGVYGWNEDDTLRTRLSGTTGMVSFSGATGEVLRVRPPGDVDGGAPLLVRQVLSDLHMATFGGLAVKWLYFLCGLAGTAMMVTGAILFMVKRRNKHDGEFGSATARVYRLIEGLNVAAIVGLAIACVGFLWANRLIPLALEHRAERELWAFFAVWALALAHAFVRPPQRAWAEQLAALAALCLLLPVLNVLTTGDHLAAQIIRNDWESAGVELTVLALGVVSAWTARHVVRKPSTGQAQRLSRPHAAAA